MFCDSSGRFGVLPHVCSYEVKDEYGEVISNFLFFPAQAKLAEYHWPIFSKEPPKNLDTRTYKHSIFIPDGKDLRTAESPFHLSRAWADSLLGVLVVVVLGPLD